MTWLRKTRVYIIFCTLRTKEAGRPNPETIYSFWHKEEGENDEIRDKIKQSKMKKAAGHFKEVFIADWQR